MSDDGFIYGSDLRKFTGIEVYIIDNVVSSGCSCYSIYTDSRLSSIHHAYSPDQDAVVPPPYSGDVNGLSIYHKKLAEFKLSIVKIPINEFFDTMGRLYGVDVKNKYITSLQESEYSKNNRVKVLSSTNCKPIDTRKVNSYLKIILALIQAGGSKLDPDSKNFVSSMISKVEHAGYEISENTVRVIKKELQLFKDNGGK